MGEAMNDEKKAVVRVVCGVGEEREARWAARTGPWIETRSGERWYYKDCVPEDVVLADVAYSLAHQARFNGHAPHNIAVHSMRVADLVVALGSPEHELSALVHDAHEAYVGDVVSPLKCLLPDFKRLEAETEVIVRRALGVDVCLPQVVTDADIMALGEESAAYFRGFRAWGLPPTESTLDDKSRPDAASVARMLRKTPREIANAWYDRYRALAKKIGVQVRARDLSIQGVW
jgi:hypothetical protein